jgi:hypothetical protein
MFHELLMIQYNGIRYNITNITFELSLFHFISHKHGARDDKILIYVIILNYEKTHYFHRLKITMYKPYLLIIYDFQQINLVD